MNGRARQTSSALRSASEPSSQLMISCAAQGLGARLSARATPALATVLRITPARMKVMVPPVPPARTSMTATPMLAPTMAATNSSQGVLRLMLRYMVITAPRAAMDETPSTPGSASGLRV
jgi:hypothetical protein